MTTTITERKKGTQSYFIKQSSDSEKEIIINYHCRIHESNGKLLYFLYDKDFNLLDESLYINNLSKTDSTKHQTLYALRYLKIFCDLFEIDIKTMTYAEANLLITFLRGSDIEEYGMNINLVTQRSHETILQYLAIYRRYVKYYLNLDNHILSSTKANKSFMGDHYKSPTKYIVSVKKNKAQTFVPPFIYPKQFIALLNVIQEIEDPVIRLRDECMIRLMYEHALRIGEVLCITKEDLELTEQPNFNELIYMNDVTGEVEYATKTLGIIIHRNRLINEQGRHCKNLMRVSSTKAYASKDYNTELIGYTKTVISEELYEMIIDYIEMSSVEYKTKKSAGVKRQEADSVAFYKLPTTERKALEKNKRAMRRYNNRYVFLNSIGGKLAYGVWNEHLKELFKKAGIEIDEGTKKNGLNHRFRHGYAMRRIYGSGEKVTEEEMKLISREMRHTNYYSVNAYINPTPAMIINQKNAYLSFDNILSNEKLEKLQEQFEKYEAVNGYFGKEESNNE